MTTPLLAVFENFVLAAIGELDAEKEQSTGALVKRTFGGGADWMATVRKTLGMTESLDAELKQLWAGNKEKISAAQFAQMVAEENFAPLIPGAGRKK